MTHQAKQRGTVSSALARPLAGTLHDGRETLSGGIFPGSSSLALCVQRANCDSEAPLLPPQHCHQRHLQSDYRPAAQTRMHACSCGVIKLSGSASDLIAQNEDIAHNKARDRREVVWDEMMRQHQASFKMAVSLGVRVCVRVGARGGVLWVLRCNVSFFSVSM